MRAERGAATVEFALFAMFLVLIVSGIVDLGRGFYTAIALNDAVQEGAMFAAFTDDIAGSNLTAADMREAGITDKQVDPFVELAPGRENLKTFGKQMHLLSGIRGPLAVEGGTTSDITVMFADLSGSLSKISEVFSLCEIARVTGIEATTIAAKAKYGAP